MQKITRASFVGSFLAVGVAGTDIFLVRKVKNVVEKMTTPSQPPPSEHEKEVREARELQELLKPLDATRCTLKLFQLSGFGFGEDLDMLIGYDDDRKKINMNDWKFEAGALQKVYGEKMEALAKRMEKLRPMMEETLRDKILEQQRVIEAQEEEIAKLKERCSDSGDSIEEEKKEMEEKKYAAECRLVQRGQALEKELNGDRIAELLN